MSDKLFLKNLIDKFVPQLALDTPDPTYALTQLPTKISLIMHENEELRVENAQKTMALERMSSTYDTACAANTKKIKSLEDEVKQLREKNDELMKEEQKNGANGSVPKKRPSASHSDQQQSLAVQGTRQRSIRLVVYLVAVFILAYTIGVVLMRY